MSNPVTICVGGDSPVSTLHEARDLARSSIATGSPVVVEIASGDYRLDEPLDLDDSDGGTESAPVIWRPRQGEEVRLHAGALLDGFQRVDDEATLQRLPEHARGKVWQVDLARAGVTNFGHPAAGGLELFFDGTPLTLARWPNEGFDRITGLVGGDPVDVRGTRGDAQGNLYVRRTRLQRWAAEPDPWAHGYWFWDWADERHRIQRVDAEYGVLELEPPAHRYGYRTGQWFYGYNLLCELDEPGEWYLDRQTGVLYLWPPTDVDAAEVSVSVGQHVVRMKGVANLTLQGLTFEFARGDAVQVRDARQVVIDNCTFRNLGGWAVTVSGGHGVRVKQCHIHGTGNGGIVLAGGDRTTLSSSDHVAEDNHIHHYGRVNRMYQPALQISGVGQQVRHNHIHHAPHMAIQFAGNDHLIELNEIHHVCLESNDAGAIYSGRDWTWRGTIIRHNLLWEITGFEDRGCVGVYLDDMLCGTQITGNLFYRVTRAAMIGGGRDCLVQDNLFVDCVPATHVDARAMNWASYHVETTMRDRLERMPVASPIWAQRYPELLTIWEEEAAAPKGNIIRRNVCQGGVWDGLREDARSYVELSANLVADDVGLEGTAPRFGLRADSLAHSIGFQQIPLEHVGPRDPSTR